MVLRKNMTKKNPAPPELIQRGLEGILTKHKENIVAPASTGYSERLKYAAGLAATVAIIAMLAGAPPLYVP